MSRPINPEPKRCGTCDVRLSRVEPDHEEACIRRANGWPPFEDGDGPEPASGVPDCQYCGGWARHEKWCRSIARITSTKEPTR